VKPGTRGREPSYRPEQDRPGISIDIHRNADFHPQGMSLGPIALSYEMAYPKVLRALKLKECLVTVTDFKSRRPVS
jgi:hypothetical protein